MEGPIHLKNFFLDCYIDYLVTSWDDTPFFVFSTTTTTRGWVFHTRTVVDQISLILLDLDPKGILTSPKTFFKPTGVKC